MFSSDAEIPEAWASPQAPARRAASSPTTARSSQSEEVETKAPRTHWDMLLERRTRAELEELLEERLEFLRARRGQAAKTGSRKSA